MEELYVKPTKRTPEVNMGEGKILLKGRSVPADPESFYQPLYDWVYQNSSKIKRPTEIILNFEYINTASTKWIFNMLKHLGSLPRAKDVIRVKWYYENGDDDMFDLGTILQSLLPSKFKLIKTAE